MKYFTFQKQFHEPILIGRKRSTIRPKVKVLADECFALRYWIDKPYRSKMGILGTAKCIHVGDFTIRPEGVLIDRSPVWDVMSLAMQEGFESAGAMFAWFQNTHGPIFHGFIHVWTDFCLPNAKTTGRPEKNTNEQ
jgi:hypothetical protein